ncbi:glycosyltransferase family 4 protein [Oceanobacillus sp. CAU 1775]
MSKKRLLYITQYFNYPHEFGSSRFYEIAKKFNEKTWDVDVLTTLTDYTNGKKKKQITNHDNFGVRVNNLKIPLVGKSFIARLIVYFTFFIKVILERQKVKPDIIYASSPSLFTGLAGVVKSKFYNVPLIYEIRDPWPESFDRLNENRILKRIILFLDNKICNHAKVIVALTPGIKRILLNRKGNKNSNIVVIPNGSLIEETVIKKESSLEIANKKRISVVFSGSLGNHTGIKFFLEVAKLMKNEQNVNFIIYGKGELDDYIEKFIKNNNLTQVKFNGFLSKESLTEKLSRFSIGFTYSPDGIYQDIAYGTKLFDYLSAGLVIIARNSKNGDMGQLLNKYKCGHTVRSEEDMVNEIKYYINNRETLIEYKKNALKALMKEFDNNYNYNKIVELSESIL